MKYTVKLYPRAYRDLDEIYSYIAVNLTEPDTASKMVSAIEEAVYGLEQFPKRGSTRKNVKVPTLIIDVEAEKFN